MVLIPPDSDGLGAFTMTKLNFIVCAVSVMRSVCLVAAPRPVRCSVSVVIVMGSANVSPILAGM